MLSAILTAPETFELRDRPPLPLSPGQARVRVYYAGVCGTDLAIWSGAYPVPLPLVLGHEWSGAVVEVAMQRHKTGIARSSAHSRHAAAEVRVSEERHVSGMQLGALGKIKQDLAE